MYLMEVRKFDNDEKFLINLHEILTISPIFAKNGKKDPIGSEIQFQNENIVQVKEVPGHFLILTRPRI